MPRKLRKKLGTNQVWKSLNTSDRDEAIKRAEPLRVQYQLLFQSKRPLTPVDLMETKEPKVIEKTQAALGLPRWHHTDFVNRPLIESFQHVVAFLEMLKEFTKSGDEPPPVVRAAGWGAIDANGIRMSEALQKYIDLNPSKVSDIPENQRIAKVQRWQLPIDDFIALFGDMDIRKIEKSHAVKFKASLENRIGKRAKGDKNSTVIRPKTANVKLTFVNMVVGTLLDSVYDIQKNPFAGLTITAKKGTGAKTEKTVLPLTEEQMLVVNAIEKTNPDIRALMDITECTGAGIRELIGLEPADIVLEGTPYPHIVVRINSRRGHLKNDNRPRILPLTTKAVEAITPYAKTGFTRYLGPSGDRAVSTRVATLLRKNGVDRSWNSFRHRFEDLLRRSGAQVDIRSALMGHTKDVNPMDNYYGDGFELEQKYNAIKTAMEYGEKKQTEIRLKMEEDAQKQAA